MNTKKYSGSTVRTHESETKRWHVMEVCAAVVTRSESREVEVPSSAPCVPRTIFLVDKSQVAHFPLR